jgi:hypothetical protein
MPALRSGREWEAQLLKARSASHAGHQLKMDVASQSQAPRFFTKEEVQFIFRGIADSTLDDWKAQGGLPHFKKGRVVLYPADGVLAWAQKRTVGRAALEGRAIAPSELQEFWGHIERMVKAEVEFRFSNFDFRLAEGPQQKDAA